MGADRNEAVARSYYDAWNRRDFDAERATLADDVVVTVVGTGERLEGAADVVEAEKGWAVAFEDGTVEIDHVVVAGDTVVVEYTGRGTHTGPLQTPDGEVPATGRTGSLGFCDVITIRNGKIAEMRAYFDTMSLMVQLGLLPESAAAS